MKSNFINLPLLAITIGVHVDLPPYYCRHQDTLVISIKSKFKDDQSVEAIKLLEKEQLVPFHEHIIRLMYQNRIDVLLSPC